MTGFDQAPLPEMPRTIAERWRNRVALLDSSYAAPARPGGPIATFTFDDFPASAYDAGGRILEAAGARGTYFVSGEFMGRTIFDVPYYEERHLKEAHAAGHEIGCHCFMHEKLSALGPGLARETCDYNARFIRNILGRQAEMTSFAYPFGDVSVWAKHLMAARFDTCRGVREAVNAGTVDRANVNITSLERRHLARLDPARLIAEAKASNGWIVFLTHDVAEDPSPYGSTPGLIEKMLHAVLDAGIDVMPFKNAAARIFAQEAQPAGLSEP